MTFFGHSTVLLTSLTFFGLFTQVLTSYDLFFWGGGFRLKCLPRQADLNQFITQAVFRRPRIDTTHDSNGFPEIDSESTDDSSGSPDIDSDRIMTQNASRFFDSNQLTVKRKTFVSESTHALTLRLTHAWWQGSVNIPLLEMIAYVAWRAIRDLCII